jgi:DNA-binding NtrC family response regulator
LDSYSLLSRSRLISDLVEEAQQIAACDCKVLITGESGVGKELLARLIHERSPRSRRPLITINCGGVAETLLESELFGHLRGSFTDAHRDRRGLLEMADGGTVLLDEVGEMSLRMQTLLLRFLESGEIQQIGSEGKHTIVDVRVISATNRDLLERTREKEFREDLYYRLNVVHLVVPPLRARREDVRLLFEHYLRLMSGQHRVAPCEVTDEAMTHLEEHSWPGNVRELKNVAERVALRYAGRVVSLDDVSRQVTDHDPARAVVAPATSPANLVAIACYERMTKNGETFTEVVHEPFVRHDLTRETVRSVVSMGLTHTLGNYRLLTELFNLPPSEYKRLLSFLKKHDCLVAFQHFRQIARPQPVESEPIARFVKAG